MLDEEVDRVLFPTALIAVVSLTPAWTAIALLSRTRLLPTFAQMVTFHRHQDQAGFDTLYQHTPASSELTRTGSTICCTTFLDQSGQG